MSDSVGNRYVTSIRDGVTALNCFPGGVLRFAKFFLLARVPANRRGIKDKLSWFSDWQKYRERNNSGRQTICAPFLAASPINSMACARFASGSGPQRICTSAICVGELFDIFNCEW